MVETLRINSGEFVGLSILRITTIPHLSILTDDQSVLGQQCAVVKVGQDFSGMLTESYQQYKDSFFADRKSCRYFFRTFMDFKSCRQSALCG